MVHISLVTFIVYISYATLVAQNFLKIGVSYNCFRKLSDMITEKNSLLGDRGYEMSEDESNTEETKKIKMTKRPKCKLDANGCLNLEDILLSFNGPISQEQAWALCYQAAKTMSTHIDNSFQEILELSQILLHKNGDVWIANLSGSRQTYVSEKKAVFSLGMMIFKTLDFGSSEEEERPLSPDLEDLIALMTDINEEYESSTRERLQDTDDEGIERDTGEADDILSSTNDNIYEENLSACSLKSILQICIRHTQSANKTAEAHYKGVIRALVAEALELSQFLDKVATEKHIPSTESLSSHGLKQTSTSLQQLDTLDFNDWARFWVQVIGELRRGVKLKKVEANLSSRGSIRERGRRAEFELTPYEILMNDIRERRYRLRKTPTPTPHLKKDAHAVILEFIRSRPPLRKASERQLPPLQKESTLRELLMESIKKPPKPLKRCKQHAATIKESLFDEQAQADTVLKENESSTAPKPSRRDLDNTNSKPKPRKIIPVDFDLKLDADGDDDDDDDDYNEDFEVTRFDEDDSDTSSYWKDDYSRVKEDDHRDDDEGTANPWRKTGGLRLTRNEYHRFCDTQLESYDLATQCPSRRASVRKHSARRNIPISSISGTTSLPHSRPQSRQHLSITGSTLSQGPSPNISLNPSPSLSPRKRVRPPQRSQTIAEGKDDHRDNEWQNEDEQKASLDMFLDERLSLTLEEIVHIRSVLTKAELESLPVEGRVKEDVEKRRVCFLCLKTRFGLLGPWGQRCRLCERTVCVKCYSKMRIPTEHFAHVPVVLLSPGLLLSPSSSEVESKNSWLRGSGAVGSAPASPASRRKDSALRSTPASTPSTTPVSVPTPTSAVPSNMRRDTDSTYGSDRRFHKATGSPAALSTTKTFASSTLGSQGSEQRLVAERLRGVAMVVCHDCRIMVIQIIKSSRTTRATIRNNVISRLTLNLSPAYV